MPYCYAAYFRFTPPLRFILPPAASPVLSPPFHADSAADAASADISPDYCHFAFAADAATLATLSMRVTLALMPLLPRHFAYFFDGHFAAAMPCRYFFLS